VSDLVSWHRFEQSSEIVGAFTSYLLIPDGAQPVRRPDPSVLSHATEPHLFLGKVGRGLFLDVRAQLVNLAP
jgi:hypothetical protein